MMITSCTESNDDGGGNTEVPGTAVISDYDDLAYFQNAVVQFDSLGKMVGCSYGEVLYDDEPEHLYIGVDNIEQAEEIFRLWMAPDVDFNATIPTSQGITCKLTDENGKQQGEVYFSPGSGTSVAEVTVSSGVVLKYFNRITFLHNSAWPHNVSIYHHYTEGDIVTYAPQILYVDDLYDISYNVLHDNDRVLNWVCIRQGGKGVKPMFCAITNNDYDCYSRTIYHRIRKSNYSPDEATAKNISKILRASWDMYVGLFNTAGCGKLLGNRGYWINHEHNNWAHFFDYIYYSSGAMYGSKPNEMKLPYLLKIDWLDDDEIKSSLAGTAGSSGIKKNENYLSLLDGQPSTKWCTHVTYKKNGVWYVEFQSNAPIIPVAYKMTTGNDCSEYRGRNPKAWKLYGKANSTDDWTLLSEISDGGMLDINCKTYSYNIDNSNYYMFFKLEVSSTVQDNVMQISEFSFVNKDPEE
jgi:hypothetical protein